MVKIYFILFPCGLTWVDKCGYERQKLPLYKNMKEENREIQCWESTQIRYGGGVTAVMTSVPLESGNCHFTKATAEPTDGDTNLTITAKYQTSTQKESFSVYEKQSWAAESAALNGRISGGGG